uniref:hypothetical protein n=1 Tax=uncultured Alistipes sp. TaxID=538949 RepID=UPI00322018E7
MMHSDQSILYQANEFRNLFSGLIQNFWISSKSIKNTDKLNYVILSLILKAKHITLIYYISYTYNNI